ncbi:MAG: pilus assembly protein PilM [Deltaproteobacteria bacterium]|nr:pilus assembly protein PilM [Deltaproteobacteria bacterium]
MASVLGLDLGSRWIKAVKVEGAGRTWTVSGWAAVPRAAPAGEGGSSLEAPLAALREQGLLSADQVVVALPGELLATHALALPFSDSKKLEAALPFEVESHLPFDLDEAVYDYQPTAQRELAPGSKEKRTELLVGVARREAVAGLLAELQSAGVDPRVITHPGLAFQSLLALSPAAFGGTGGAVAVVDVGAERTTVAVGAPGGQVEFARAFAFGGRELTKALGAALGQGTDEAEAYKCGTATVTPDGTDGQAVHAGAALSRALQPLVRELRATFKAATGRTRSAPQAVYLCGGTAALHGLPAFLSDALGIPVQRLTLPPEVRGIGPEEAGAAAQAVALALRGQLTGARAPRFNLRRGEFSFQGAHDWLRERVGRLAAYGVVLAVLYIASGAVEARLLEQRERAVDKALCDVTAKILDKCEPNFDRALSLLRGKESPAATLPRVSAATLLTELVSRIPADVPVTFDQVVVDLERITLRGETESSKQIDRLTTAIKGFHCFSEVKEGKVEKSKDGQKVAFRLDIQVECPEDGQAPQG